MRKLILTALAVALAIAGAYAQTARKTLDIYVVDVEGGNATLFVAPSRQSALIDTGTPRPPAQRHAPPTPAATKPAPPPHTPPLTTPPRHAAPSRPLQPPP